MALFDNLTQTPTQSASAQLQPGTQPKSFWDLLAGATSKVAPWMPIAYTDPTAAALQKQQDARLAQLEAQRVQQEQQVQQAILTGNYPVNAEQMKAGSSTKAVYIDPNTGGYTYQKAGTTTTTPDQGAGGGGGDTTTADTTGSISNVVTRPNFDYQAKTNEAYKALENFYNKLLDFAGGRMDLAKRTLEYIYQQGMRESAQEYEQSTAEQGLLFPRETAETTTGLNKRGVYFSGFGQEDVGTLKKSQDLRRIAVERAKENRQTRLQTERELDLAKTGSGYEEEKFNLERQRRQEAQGMAKDTYAVDSANYEANLQKSLQDETRNAQKIANTTGINASTASTSAGGFTSSDKTRFRSFMQTSGRQGELDKATAGSTQEGTAFADLMKKYKGQY